MKIHHIAIWVNDLERAKEFYTKYFGCVAGEKYSNPIKHFTSYFLSFADGACIELMKKPDILSPEQSEKIGYTHLAIEVGNRKDVDNLTRTLEIDGYIIAGQPRTTGDGYYESVILDPEGNRVELLASP